MSYIDFRLEYCEESKDEVLAIVKDLEDLGFNCKHFENGGVIFCRYNGEKYQAILNRYYGEYMYLNIFENAGELPTVMRIDLDHIGCISSL